ncbi:MAG: hypothetical protein WCC11_06765 [Gammaproteobacteria bacterium]
MTAAEAFAAKTVVEGLVQGVLTTAGGGRFGSGFLGGVTGSVVGDFLNSPQFKSLPDVAKITIAAIAGGTVAYAAGGNFGNGAMSAAFVEAFNELQHDQFREALAARFQAVMGRPPTEKELNQLRDEILQSATAASERYESLSNLRQDFPNLIDLSDFEVENQYQLIFESDLENIRVEGSTDIVSGAIVNGYNNGIEAIITAPLPAKVNIFIQIWRYILSIPDTPIPEP